jgi:hypothetical protein
LASEITNKITERTPDGFVTGFTHITGASRADRIRDDCVPAGQHCSRSTDCRNYRYLGWSRECEPLVGEYCAQAGLPDTATGCVAAWKRELSRLAAQVDAGYPDNADLIISEGHPVLKRRAGKERRARRWRWRRLCTSGCRSATCWRS